MSLGYARNAGTGPAKFASTCPRCETPIDKGARIRLDHMLAAYVHDKCPEEGK